MRLPEGMPMLRELDVKRCKMLADDWLPASSAVCLHTLNATQSNMRLVPAGITELRVLWIDKSDCPESSIPPGILCCLEELNGLPVRLVGYSCSHIVGRTLVGFIVSLHDWCNPRC